MGAMI